MSCHLSQTKDWHWKGKEADYGERGRGGALPTPSVKGVSIQFSCSQSRKSSTGGKSENLLQTRIKTDQSNKTKWNKMKRNETKWNETEMKPNGCQVNRQTTGNKAGSSSRQPSRNNFSTCRYIYPAATCCAPLRVCATLRVCVCSCVGLPVCVCVLTLVKVYQSYKMNNNKQHRSNREQQTLCSKTSCHRLWLRS